MTVLVTGATGFLGSHVTDMLLADGERPRVLVRPGDSAEAFADDGVDVVCGDIADHSALEAAVKGVDRVLHCAARTGPWGPEAEYASTNVRGLEALLDVSLSAGVGRIVHVSSACVHGTDVRGVADETAPLRPDGDPYSRSKVAAERLLDRAIRDRGAPVTIVRPGWIYGPRDTASFARVVAMIERGRMPILGSGRNHVPLIYVGDVARAVLLASEATQAARKSYLLVNDEPVTQRDFVGAIAAELRVPIPKRHIPYRLALAVGATAETVGHLARLQQAPPLTRFGLQLLGGENRFIISRARHDLGFAPSVNLAEGVRRGVAWYRATRSATEGATRSAMEGVEG